MDSGNLKYLNNFMVRINLLAIGLVSVLALTGCGTPTPTADSAGKAVTEAAGDAKDKAVDVAGAAKDKATDVIGAADAAKDKVAGAADATKDKVAAVAGAAKDNVAGAADATKDKVAAVAGAAKDKVTGAIAPELVSLAGAVTSTKSAIDTGNFAQAKMEAAKLNELWAKAEAGVKSKSPAVAQVISTGLTNVTGAVNQEDKAKAQAALTALSKAFTTVK
jgi:hypothetical protein